MRIIWITPHHPDPSRGGGEMHEYEILRALAGRHEIHLITDHPPEKGERLAVSELGLSLEWVECALQEHPHSRLGMAWAMLRAKPTLTFWLLRDRLRAMSEALVQAEARQPADLVHATHGELAPVLEAARAPTSLLLFDSRVRDMERQLERETVPRRRLQRRVERWRSAQWERRWYAGVDGLAAVSSLDAAVTRRLLGRPVEVLPLPVPDGFFGLPRLQREAGSVGFIGSLAYPPNLDALRWLVGEIWPLVRKEAPDAQLRIAGRAEGDMRAVPGLGDALDSAGATLDTNVPDILPWYWRSSVLVAPLRLGSGLRTKIIHAMAAGAPVVATPTALDGIDAIPGRDVLVGTTAAEIAECVVELLLDARRAEQVATSARRVADPFRSEIVNERVDAWLQAAAGRHRRTPEGTH